MSDTDPRGQRCDGNRGSNTRAVADSTLDQTVDVLATYRRRAVLAALQADPGGVLTIDDLADHLLAQAPDATDRDRELIALYHKTLPRLADAGLIDLDRRTDTVRYRGHDLVEDLLDVIAHRND